MSQSLMTDTLQPVFGKQGLGVKEGVEGQAGILRQTGSFGGRQVKE